MMIMMIVKKIEEEVGILFFKNLSDYVEDVVLIYIGTWAPR